MTARVQNPAATAEQGTIRLGRRRVRLWTVIVTVVVLTAVAFFALRRMGATT